MTILEGQAVGAEVPRPAPRVEGDHEQLCAQYAWLRAVSRNLVRDPWSAEDVAQETLLAALAAPPRDASDPQHMRAWLGRVAFNLSRLGARSAARRQAREVRVARRESLPGVSEELELAATTRVLDGAIGALSALDQRVVRLRYYEGLSTAEIARRTGTSEIAVRKRLWRARNRLRVVLERGSRRGQLWAVLLAWKGRALRSQGLAGLAAGLALAVGGLALWTAPERARPAARLAGPERASGRRASLGDDAAALGQSLEGGAGSAGVRGLPRPGRHPILVPLPPVDRDPPPVRLAHGVVLDLEGRGQGGLALVAPAEPEAILATSDLLGRFQLRSAALPRALEARGPGWTTLVRAQPEDAAEGEPLAVVVAPAADLRVHVLDEQGFPVPEASLELRCQETAFAALPVPVRLASATLQGTRSDAGGLALLSALPRGEGLELQLEAEGFEPRVLDTLALGAEEWLTLRTEPAAAVLAGAVLHRDGRPAAGARVSLARARTIADARGHYRLPLRGVRADSCLSAEDAEGDSAPLALERFGAHLLAGPEPGSEPREHELDLVLGPQHARVTGRIRSPEAQGWLVAAFARPAAALGEDGRERPLGVTRSAADGAFAFALPEGDYDLYALPPEGAAVVRRTLSTRAGAWIVEAPTVPELALARTRLGGDDGRPLAGASVTVRVLLDGAAGARALAWKELASDARGEVAFARDPALALELAVVHPRGTRTVALAGAAADGLAAEIVIPRPAFAQLRDAPDSLAALVVLDDAGRELFARGPLRSAREFGLRAGSSPVLEVPPEARWLELRSSGSARLRVALDPRPGETRHVRP